MALPLWLRHLDYGPRATVDDLGRAGIEALLESRDASAWTGLLAAVRDDPWGPVAGRIEAVLDHLTTHGTQAALRGWLDRCRAGLERQPVGLRVLRAEAGLTQRELAYRMGLSQAQVARLERSANPTMASISRYLRSLGHDPIGIVARSRDGTSVVIEWP